MKLLIAATLTLSLLAPPTLSAAEIKRVCVEQVHAKTKKSKQVCKDVKVHKKLEGTKVPGKKAK
jgi:hypothetical protein